MRRIIAIMALVLACAAPDESLRTLEASGFHDIEILGWDAFECGKDDMYSTGFRATNADGRRVQGVVCCGMLKSCTVRF